MARVYRLGMSATEAMQGARRVKFSEDIDGPTRRATAGRATDPYLLRQMQAWGNLWNRTVGAEGDDLIRNY
jgi:hypothetical protein